MIEWFTEYGMFLAKSITVVVAIGAIVAIIASAAKRGSGRDPDHIEVTRINDRLRELKRDLEHGLLEDWERKSRLKAEKKREKSEAKEKKRSSKASSGATDAEGFDRKRVFVLDFKGDIKASHGDSLRDEVTALLTLATPNDEIVVRLENAGGTVHGHGFAASQLTRFRDREIPLTILIDKVAASGGYMMACVGTRILAAPFAIIGSIGVLFQIPNFHRLLDRHGIDFEQIKAGKYKRTVTLFGETKPEDRAKLQEEIDGVHELFQSFVATYRPALDVAKVATGEHWYGPQALSLGLVDAISTSDDYLMTASETADIFEVKLATKQSMAQKLSEMFANVADRVIDGVASRLS
jgi:serine protease SohB